MDTLEHKVNEWLISEVRSNLDHIYTNSTDHESYRNFNYCDDFFDIIFNTIKKNNYDITHKEELKDNITYLLYKYST